MYCNKIDISEGIDLARSSGDKESMTCHYWFFNQEFKYKDFICNGCRGLVMQCVNIIDIVIIALKSAGYGCIVHGISKSDSINLLKNPLSNDSGYI